MVTQMDDGVGRVVDALNETGMIDNTLIVFMSDVSVKTKAVCQLLKLLL